MLWSGLLTRWPSSQILPASSWPDPITRVLPDQNIDVVNVQALHILKALTGWTQNESVKHTFARHFRRVVPSNSRSVWEHWRSLEKLSDKRCGSVMKVRPLWSPISRRRDSTTTGSSKRTHTWQERPPLLQIERKTKEGIKMLSLLDSTARDPWMMCRASMYESTFPYPQIQTI